MVNDHLARLSLHLHVLEFLVRHRTIPNLRMVDGLQGLRSSGSHNGLSNQHPYFVPVILTRSYRWLYDVCGTKARELRELARGICSMDV